MFVNYICQLYFTTFISQLCSPTFLSTIFANYIFQQYLSRMFANYICWQYLRTMCVNNIRQLYLSTIFAIYISHSVQMAWPFSIAWTYIHRSNIGFALCRSKYTNYLHNLSNPICWNYLCNTFLAHEWRLEQTKKKCHEVIKEMISPPSPIGNQWIMI